MKIRDINIDFKDNRGTISDLFYDEKINHVADIRTYNDCIRGNHYHKKTTQHIFVYKGFLEYWYKKLNSNDDAKKIIVNENQIVSTPPLEIHALKITTINYFIVFATGQRGGKDYESDTFRVEPIIL